MLKITDRHVRAVGVIGTVAGLAAQWIIGVLIGKVLGQTVATTETETVAPDGDQQESSPLYRIILLRDVSFNNTILLAACIIFIKALFDSGMTSLALLRAVRIGRKLRLQVMDRAIGASAGKNKTRNFAGNNTNVEQVAVDLVLKTKIIQDFLANGEHLVFYNRLRILLCVVLIFVFLWWAALLAIGVLALSHFFLWILEHFRSQGHELVERVAGSVQRRLLDVVKNATMIQVMDMAQKEHEELEELEKQSDEALQKDAFLRFIRETSQVLPLAFLPVALVVITWSQMDEQGGIEVVEAGTSLLIVMLLLAEAHKSMVNLSFIFDREVAYLEARAIVYDFIGKEKRSLKSDIGTKSPSRRASKTAELDDMESANMESTLELAMAPSTFKKTIVPDSDYLSVDQITLFYSGRAQPVLHNFSKSFARGKIHGIVGESGSGKSTTINVFASLLVPARGTLTVWENMKIAYVSQNQKLFCRTIREIVTYGNNLRRQQNVKSHYDDNDTDDLHVWKALRTANIASWVSSLPHGLDTMLEDGENMVSGGQLQRLLLSHLFCSCQDADVVILDECMSALDQNSRHILTENLKQFLHSSSTTSTPKTALVITHHNEILDICDEIHDFTPKIEPPLVHEQPQEISVTIRT